MAGCTLGAALEFEPVEKAKAWALHFGDQFPPADYWSHVKDPMSSHYITGKNIDLTKGHMNAVPPDDDTVYTLLGLLLMEQYGFDFTGENLAEIWKRYLPLGPKEDDPGQRGCWWGERQMLKCLLNGMTLPEAGLFRNPNLQNIAAWTRADSYGYVCAGWPEKAAELAYRDAFTNHRRNGVYGSMFMAAVIAAAFVVDDPMEAVQIGLSEIPENCLFAEGVRWALEQNPSDYKQAYVQKWQQQFIGDSFDYDYHMLWDWNFDLGGYRSAEVLFHDMKDLHRFGINGIRLLEQQDTITFSRYPRSAEWILNIRETINHLIEQAVNS